MATYTTTQGQTWDQISLDVYGSVYKYPAIIDANPDYIDVLIFSSGTVLNIPDEVEEAQEVSKDYPAWRAEFGGE